MLLIIQISPLGLLAISRAVQEYRWVCAMRGEDREFVQGLRQSKSYASTIPTYSELVDQVELLADTNGDLAQARFFMHPSILCALLKWVIDADGGITTA